MKNISSQPNVTNSADELETNLLSLRDTINELLLTLTDLQFQIDIEQRNKAVDLTRTCLERCKPNQGDQRY